MGRLAAESMLEATGDLGVALGWHLTSNHYPPLPGYVFDMAKQAIDLARDEDWDATIDISPATKRDGSSQATVRECVAAWHLEAFI